MSISSYIRKYAAIDIFGRKPHPPRLDPLPRQPLQHPLPMRPSGACSSSREPGTARITRAHAANTGSLTLQKLFRHPSVT